MSAQVAPTRMALQMYKGKLVGAKKGYELLKKKSDALKVNHSGSYCPFGNRHKNCLYEQGCSVSTLWVAWTLQAYYAVVNGGQVILCSFVGLFSSALVVLLCSNFLAKTIPISFIYAIVTFLAKEAPNCAPLRLPSPATAVLVARYQIPTKMLASP